MTPLTFAQAQDYLLSFANYEQKDRFAYNTRTWDITAFRRFLDELGAPDRSLRIIHLAGTNGKGSTAAAVTSLLTAAGERVGLYTSPHLVTIRERIRLGDELISEEDFARLTSQLAEVQERLGHGVDGGYRTTFELLTALALLYFAEQKATWAVLETGLGGRLDATNVVEQPVLCLLTSIALDHEGVLGETLEEIAAEKAGILKSDVPVISAPQVKEVAAVLTKHAAKISVPLSFSGYDSDFIQTGSGELFWKKHLLPLRGAFQLTNLSLALRAYLRLAEDYDLPTDEGTLTLGLTSLRWAGRMEIIHRDPTVILDGGHNPAALKAVLAEINKLPARRRLLVFGASTNKKLDELANLITDHFDHFYLTQAPTPRAASVEELAGFFPPEKSTLIAEGVEKAVEMALNEANPDDLIAVLGSIYVVGEVKKYAGELGLSSS